MFLVTLVTPPSWFGALEAASFALDETLCLQDWGARQLENCWLFAEMRRVGYVG